LGADIILVNTAGGKSQGEVQQEIAEELRKKGRKRGSLSPPKPSAQDGRLWDFAPAREEIITLFPHEKIRCSGVPPCRHFCFTHPVGNL